MTAIPTIGALPPPPQRGQEEELFIQRADAFIDALAAFVTQMNAFGAQLVQSTQERVVNEAAASYAGALAARDAAIAARDAAQGFANSIDPATLVRVTGNQSIAGTKNFTGVIHLTGKALTLAATYAEASTADVRANVTERLLSVRSLWDAMVPVVLADAATIALDLSTGIHFTVTLAGNRTLAAPTNGKPGQEGFIRVVQDGTGGRALSFAAAYKFPDLATAPSLNTAAGAVTLLRYHVSAAGEVFLSGGKPSGGKRVATLAANGAAQMSDIFYADVAMTLSYIARTLQNSETMLLVKKGAVSGSSGFGSASETTVFSGQSGSTGTVAMAAGEMLAFSTSNSPAYCHLVQQ